MARQSLENRLLYFFGLDFMNGSVTLPPLPVSSPSRFELATAPSIHVVADPHVRGCCGCCVPECAMIPPKYLRGSHRFIVVRRSLRTICSADVLSLDTGSIAEYPHSVPSWAAPERAISLITRDFSTPLPRISICFLRERTARPLQFAASRCGMAVVKADRLL